jgi:hypothetical protein
MRTAFLLLACAVSLLAQRNADYDYSVVSQVRIDLRDLGYPPIDVIPSDESAIRALTVAPNGAIYGATSGRRSHLFVLYPVHGYVQPLGYLDGVNTVHRAVVVSKSGDVYIGSSARVDNGGTVTINTQVGASSAIRLSATSASRSALTPPARSPTLASRARRKASTPSPSIAPQCHLWSDLSERPLLQLLLDDQVHRPRQSGRTAYARRELREREEHARAIAVTADGGVFAPARGFLYQAVANRLEKLAVTAPPCRGVSS